MLTTKYNLICDNCGHYLDDRYDGFSTMRSLSQEAKRRWWVGDVENKNPKNIYNYKKSKLHFCCDECAAEYEIKNLEKHIKK